MTKLSIDPIDWNDILKSESDSDSSSDSSSDASSNEEAVQSLVGPPPKFRGYLLVTFNHPRTVSFSNATSEQQKIMYCKKLDKMPRYLYGVNATLQLICVDCCFEYCDSGAVHYHALMEVTCNRIFSIAGLVCDYAKHWLALLPKKWSSFHEYSYWVDYQRYKVPSCCIQYKSYDDNYIPIWKEYLHKKEYNK